MTIMAFPGQGTCRLRSLWRPLARISERVHQ